MRNQRAIKYDPLAWNTEWLRLKNTATLHIVVFDQDGPSQSQELFLKDKQVSLDCWSHLSVTALRRSICIQNVLFSLSHSTSTIYPSYFTFLISYTTKHVWKSETR